MYNVAYLTDKGLVKENNEDAFLVDENLGLFVVADGMGGHERGEVASHLLVESFKQILSKDEESTVTYSEAFNDDETVPYFEDEDEDATLAYDMFEGDAYVENRLNGVVEQATKNIHSYVKEKSIVGQIGTTVVGLYRLEEERMALFHLGDSRAYQIRNNTIVKLTIDHSKYEKYKQSGKYTKEQLAKVNRNSITKAIGNFKAMPLEINYVDLAQNDVYVLCSDGVSDLLHADEMLKIVEEQKSLDEAINQIKTLVYERGAKDNLSIIIFRYDR